AKQADRAGPLRASTYGQHGAGNDGWAVCFGEIRRMQLGTDAPEPAAAQPAGADQPVFHLYGSRRKRHQADVEVATPSTSCGVQPAIANNRRYNGVIIFVPM